MVLVPDAAIIYERVDNVIYARYRDPPHNKHERWVVGGTVNKQIDWNHLESLAETNKSLKEQLDKLLLMYYIIKDAK